MTKGYKRVMVFDSPKDAETFFDIIDAWDNGGIENGAQYGTTESSFSMSSVEEVELPEIDQKAQLMDTTWKLTVEFDSKDDAEQLIQIIDDWTAGGLHSLWRSTYSGFDNPPYWPNELYLLVSGLEEVTSETSLVNRGMMERRTH
jgi:hypothetical protein